MAQYKWLQNSYKEEEINNMKKIIKNTLAALMAFAVAFTGIPALAGGFSVNAASAAPAQVKEINARYSHNYVRLKWSKVKTKGLSGYTVFRGGKALKSVSAKKLTYKDTKVKASKKYSYYVRAYKNIKQKRYFNTKTNKWQADKPAAKNWKGKKTKTVTVKKYGKASPTMKVKTLAAPKKTSSKKKTTKKTSGKTNTSTVTHSTNYNMNISKTSGSISFTLSELTADSEVRIYRGTKLIGLLKDTKTTKTDANLKADTEYSYEIKLYYKGELKKTRTRGIRTEKAQTTTTTTKTTTATP